METTGTTDTLFDMNEYAAPDNGRAPRMSQEEKERRRLEEIDKRELRNLENRINRGLPLTADQRQALKELREQYGLVSEASLPEGVVRTMNEVAAHFGKHVQTIKNWASKGMPRNPDTYNLSDIEAWAVSKQYVEPKAEDESESQTGGGVGPVPGVSGEQNTKVFYETQLKKVQAKLKALELAKAMGKLLPAEEVESREITRILVVKRALLAVPRTLAPQLVGLESREIEAVLMEKMRAVCTKFAGGEG